MSSEGVKYIFFDLSQYFLYLSHYSVSELWLCSEVLSIHFRKNGGLTSQRLLEHLGDHNFLL